MKFLSLFCLCLMLMFCNGNSQDVDSTNTMTVDAALFESLKQPFNIKSYFLLLPDAAFESAAPQGSWGLLPFLPEKRQNLLETGIVDSTLWRLDTLDYRNGYIKFHSDTDGFSYTYEITYFQQSDGRRMVAVAIHESDMCCETTDFAFYRLEDRQWREITTEVIPELTLSDFLSSEADLSEFSYEFVQKPPMKIELPQRGKNLKVILSTETFDEFRDVGEAEDFWPIFDEYLKRTELTLYWADGPFSKVQK